MSVNRKVTVPLGSSDRAALLPRDSERQFACRARYSQSGRQSRWRWIGLSLRYVAPRDARFRAPGQDDLSTRLATSSSEFAGSALAAMSDGKQAVFLLHSATALEHLAKAVLADRHPSLIAVAAKDNFNSLLHLLGEKVERSRKDPHHRSAGSSAAGGAVRARVCVPFIKDLTLLILVRDGVAHLADASSADVGDVLVPYLKASEELRELLTIDRAELLGRVPGPRRPGLDRTG